MSTDSPRVYQLSELENWIGKEVGLSPYMVINQERIDTFAKATEDFQWIHTDPVLSAEHSLYGSTIAHGFLVLSLAPKLLYECLHIEDAVMAVNYGLDKVRFPHPVAVDSEIRSRINLLAYEGLEEGAKLTLQVKIEIKGNDKPGCTAEFIVLIVNTDTENI